MNITRHAFQVIAPERGDLVALVKQEKIMMPLPRGSLAVMKPDGTWEMSYGPLEENSRSHTVTQKGNKLIVDGTKYKARLHVVGQDPEGKDVSLYSAEQARMGIAGKTAAVIGFGIMSLLPSTGCKKGPVPFDIKIINNLSGYTGPYPAFRDEEVTVKPTDLGAGIDQQRLAVYTLNQNGDGLESKVGFTNTNGEIRFIATNASGYAIVTYTPVQTSKGSLYELVDAQPAPGLLARNVKAFRYDDPNYPPTSFPDNPDGIIQECVSELDQGLHPNGFNLGSIAWASGNLGAGYTSRNSDGWNGADHAYVNWTRIKEQYGSGANGLRVLKMTFKSEIIERCGNVDDIAGDTGRFVEDQAVLNALTSYLFSRN